MKNKGLLFSHSFHNPLEERVGKQFFADLPQKPGVYKMLGSSGSLLYVGKSKNLRRRLFTYRHANRANSSRKVCRLVQMIREIEYIVCASEEQALLKENALIREFQPEFNRAKKLYNTYYYLAITRFQDKLRFHLDMNLPENFNSKTKLYGAFKEHGVVRGGTGALLRQLYLIEHRIDTPFNFPHTLLNKFTPSSYILPVEEGLIAEEEFEQLLFLYLNGSSRDLLKAMTEIVEKRNLLDKFIGKLILIDLKSLDVFSRHCLNRNRQIKDKLNLSERYIPQEKLDDYLIKAAFKETNKNNVE